MTDEGEQMLLAILQSIAESLRILVEMAEQAVENDEEL